jgi:hypothetical protein
MLHWQPLCINIVINQTLKKKVKQKKTIKKNYKYTVQKVTFSIKIIYHK